MSIYERDSYYYSITDDFIIEYWNVKLKKLNENYNLGTTTDKLLGNKLTKYQIHRPDSPYRSYNNEPNNTNIFSFSFSIEKEKENIFQKIFNNLIEKECITHDFNNKKINIESLKLNINKLEHIIYNKTFIRYEYNFYKSNIEQLVLYTSYLYDSIIFLNKLIDDEVLLKYKIGDLVSFRNDKSDDYMIMDYMFCKTGSSKATYDILYYISKVSHISKNSIIYDDTFLALDKDLNFSRNGRIDNIIS